MNGKTIFANHTAFLYQREEHIFQTMVKIVKMLSVALVSFAALILLAACGNKQTAAPQTEIE